MLTSRLVLALCLLASEARADPLRVFAAGSLAAALPDLIAASGLPEGSVAAPVFGPAGVLRQRIQGGEAADLFASADLAQPRALAEGRDALVIPFARNRMCVLTADRPAPSSDALLDRMLSPSVRLAASTPGADPGGDYALAVFARAEILRPGAERTLASKTLRLLGGPGSMQPRPGLSAAATILIDGRAEMLLYYCSGADAAAKEAPGLASVRLPDDLEPRPVYGLAVLSARPEAARLALFIVSERGQAILARAGLLPLAASQP